MTGKPTLDTNVLIYAFGKHEDKRKHVAKEIITNCNIISLQVVNETAYVLLRKFNFQEVASALDNHCSVLYTEDLQHEQIIEGCLQIINPFINTKE